MKNGMDTFSVMCKTEKMTDIFSGSPTLRVIHNNIRNTRKNAFLCSCISCPLPLITLTMITTYQRSIDVAAGHHFSYKKYNAVH